MAVRASPASSDCRTFAQKVPLLKLLCSQIVNLVLLFAQQQPGLEQPFKFRRKSELHEWCDAMALLGHARHSEANGGRKGSISAVWLLGRRRLDPFHLRISPLETNI